MDFQGKFLAKADPKSAAWTTSSQKGTTGVEIVFVIEPGEEHAGTRVKWIGWFTDKTQERTIESLRYAGCTFPGDDITNLAGLGSSVAQIVVAPDKYGPRVDWVNDPTKGGKPLDTPALTSFAEQMKMAVQMAKRNGERAAEAPTAGGAGAEPNIGF